MIFVICFTTVSRGSVTLSMIILKPDRLMSRATVDVEGVRQFVGSALLRGVYLFVLMIAITVLLLSLNWKLALISLSVIPFISFRTVVINQKLRVLWIKIQQGLGVLGTVVQENLTRVRVVRAFAREDFESKKFRRQAESIYNRDNEIKYPTANCGALREREPPHPRLRTRPLSSRQQADGYSAETFIKTTLKMDRIDVHFALNPDSEASRLVNGREMTAEDLAWSMESEWAAEGSNFQVFFKPEQWIISAKALDKYTVEVKTPPNAQGLNLLESGERCSIFAREVTEKYGDQNDWELSVGVGAFMLTDYVAGSSLTYTRNPNYYAFDPFHPENRLPYMDAIK